MNLTICIATYGDNYWEQLALTRALPSVQNFPCEILIGHDPDGTIATARNNLAERATSEWLCFLDADDELDAGFLDALRTAEKITRDGTPRLLTPAVRQVRKGRPGRPFFFPECSFETGNWLIIGTLVPTDLFMEVGGFHEHPHGLEDFNFWARCVKAGARIVKVPKAVYIAHWNAKSKHHVFARNRPAYMKAYEIARADV